MEYTSIVSASNPQLVIYTCNLTSGGTAIPFGINGTLTLTFDGNPVATAAVKASDSTATFKLDVASLSEGWYMASVSGLDSSWSVLDYGAYVLKGGSAQSHALMPVVTASHELIFSGGGTYQQAWVPTRFQPITVPYPPRDFPDMPVAPTRGDVVITSLAVPRPGDLYRPAMTKEGVWTTANRENYFYFDFESAKPILPMLDGPRGRGSIIAPVHLEVGNAAPNGALRGNVYFVESWRVGKVTPDGTVITLAGFRHKDIASYWNDPTSAELIGDWSSVPSDRRGFAQPWGMAWDARTLTTNESVPPIPSENNEKPHIYGPVMYISDTYRNRVLKLQFSATAHGVPPKVTEFVTGLNQPWDVIAVGTKLYVSDRMNNAIKVYDMDTAGLLSVINVTQPEGMAQLDGWLYYASVKSKSIRKIELATGNDVLISDASTAGSGIGYYINNNSRFMKIAVSDGSFGPRGMIAYTTWSNSYYGYPNLIDGATGKMIDWLTAKSGDKVKGTSPLGLGSYSSAVGIGHGRMLFGTAEEGLHVVSKALPTDVVVDATKYKAGMTQWQTRGYTLLHGQGGYGFYGLPLPWGESPEIDYFLTQNLHTPSKLGNARVEANPYGAMIVQGATFDGSAISDFQPAATMQLGSTPGTAGTLAKITFDGLNVPPGSSLTIRSGAADQAIVLLDTSASGSNIGGSLKAEGGNGAAPPSLYVHNANGITVATGGAVSGSNGLTLDALLDSNVASGQPVVNYGSVDGGPSLAVFGAKIGGSGAFKADAIDLRTFGNANNPINTRDFLANGLQLYPSSGNTIAVTLNGYGSTPQAFNLMFNANGVLAMPSTWTSLSPWPPNNPVVPPGSARSAGAPDPSYGGGSIIVQARGDLTLANGATGDFTFPGAIVLIADGTLDFNGVQVANAWTTSGAQYQGMFFEAPRIVNSGGAVRTLTNNQNWVNFSVKPESSVRAWQLTRTGDGSASYAAADLIAPHLNTFSTITKASAAGQCWTCLMTSTPADLY